MSFFERHRGTLLGLATVLGVGAMIWIDAHRVNSTEGAPKAGTKAPALTLTTLGSGEKVSLPGLQGKPAVLDFWATWCEPCKRSLPGIDRLAKRYEGKARVFAVNSEGEALDLQSEVRLSLGLSLPILQDGAEASAWYRIQNLPTTVILDRNGNVAQSFVGAQSEETIAAAIDRLL